MSDLATRNLPELANGGDVVGNIRSVLGRLPEMSAEETNNAAIWADAIAMAGRAQRAIEAAREAELLRIEAERRLGEMGNHDDPEVRRAFVFALGSDFARQSRLINLGAVPRALFDSIVGRLFARPGAKRITNQVVIRLAAQESLKRVEPGVWRAWNGDYYTGTGRLGLPKKSKETTLEGARNAYLKEVNLGQSRVAPSKQIDDAFSRARRLALDVAAIREGDVWHPDAFPVLQEAELAQMKVASLLHKAYLLFKLEAR